MQDPANHQNEDNIQPQNIIQEKHTIEHTGTDFPFKISIVNQFDEFIDDQTLGEDYDTEGRKLAMEKKELEFYKNQFANIVSKTERSKGENSLEGNEKSMPVTGRDIIIKNQNHSDFVMADDFSAHPETVFTATNDVNIVISSGYPQNEESHPADSESRRRSLQQRGGGSHQHQENQNYQRSVKTEGNQNQAAFFNDGPTGDQFRKSNKKEGFQMVSADVKIEDAGGCSMGDGGTSRPDLYPIPLSRTQESQRIHKEFEEASFQGPPKHSQTVESLHKERQVLQVKSHRNEQNKQPLIQIKTFGTADFEQGYQVRSPNELPQLSKVPSSIRERPSHSNQDAFKSNGQSYQTADEPTNQNSFSSFSPAKYENVRQPHSQTKKKNTGNQNSRKETHEEEPGTERSANKSSMLQNLMEQIDRLNEKLEGRASGRNSPNQQVRGSQATPASFGRKKKKKTDVSRGRSEMSDLGVNRKLLETSGSHWTDKQSRKPSKSDARRGTQNFGSQISSLLNKMDELYYTCSVSPCKNCFKKKTPTQIKPHDTITTNKESVGGSSTSQFQPNNENWPKYSKKSSRRRGKRSKKQSKRHQQQYEFGKSETSSDSYSVQNSQRSFSPTLQTDTEEVERLKDWIELSQDSKKFKKRGRQTRKRDSRRHREPDNNSTNKKSSRRRTTSRSRKSKSTSKREKKEVMVKICYDDGTEERVLKIDTDQIMKKKRRGQKMSSSSRKDSSSCYYHFTHSSEYSAENSEGPSSRRRGDKSRRKSRRRGRKSKINSIRTKKSQFKSSQEDSPTNEEDIAEFQSVENDNDEVDKSREEPTEASQFYAPVANMYSRSKTDESFVRVRALEEENSGPEVFPSAKAYTDDMGSSNQQTYNPTPDQSCFTHHQSSGADNIPKQTIHGMARTKLISVQIRGEDKPPQEPRTYHKKGSLTNSIVIASKNSEVENSQKDPQALQKNQQRLQQVPPHNPAPAPPHQPNKRVIAVNHSKVNKRITITHKNKSESCGTLQVQNNATVNPVRVTPRDISPVKPQNSSTPRDSRQGLPEDKPRQSLTRESFSNEKHYIVRQKTDYIPQKSSRSSNRSKSMKGSTLRLSDPPTDTQRHDSRGMNSGRLISNSPFGSQDYLTKESNLPEQNYRDPSLRRQKSMNEVELVAKRPGDSERHQGYQNRIQESQETTQNHNVQEIHYRRTISRRDSYNGSMSPPDLPESKNNSAQVQQNPRHRNSSLAGEDNNHHKRVIRTPENNDQGGPGRRSYQNTETATVKLQHNRGAVTRFSPDTPKQGMVTPNSQYIRKNNSKNTVTRRNIPPKSPSPTGSPEDKRLQRGRIGQRSAHGGSALKKMIKSPRSSPPGQLSGMSSPRKDNVEPNRGTPRVSVMISSPKNKKSHPGRRVQDHSDSMQSYSPQKPQYENHRRNERREYSAAERNSHRKSPHVQAQIPPNPDQDLSKGMRGSRHAHPDRQRSYNREQDSNFRQHPQNYHREQRESDSSLQKKDLRFHPQNDPPGLHPERKQLQGPKPVQFDPYRPDRHRQERSNHHPQNQEPFDPRQRRRGVPAPQNPPLPLSQRSLRTSRSNLSPQPNPPQRFQRSPSEQKVAPVHPVHPYPLSPERSSHYHQRISSPSTKQYDMSRPYLESPQQKVESLCKVEVPLSPRKDYQQDPRRHRYSRSNSANSSNNNLRMMMVDRGAPPPAISHPSASGGPLPPPAESYMERQHFDGSYPSSHAQHPPRHYNHRPSRSPSSQNLRNFAAVTPPPQRNQSQDISPGSSYGRAGRPSVPPLNTRATHPQGSFSRSRSRGSMHNSRNYRAQDPIQNQYSPKNESKEERKKKSIRRESSQKAKSNKGAPRRRGYQAQQPKRRHHGAVETRVDVTIQATSSRKLEENQTEELSEAHPLSALRLFIDFQKKLIAFRNGTHKNIGNLGKIENRIGGLKSIIDCFLRQYQPIYLEIRRMLMKHSNQSLRLDETTESNDSSSNTLFSGLCHTKETDIILMNSKFVRSLQNTKKTIKKAKTLLEQSRMFDKESQAPFIQGIKNVMTKSIKRLSNAVKQVIKCYLQILEESTGANTKDSTSRLRASDSATSMRFRMSGFPDNETIKFSSPRLELENSNQSRISHNLQTSNRENILGHPNHKSDILTSSCRIDTTWTENQRLPSLGSSENKAKEIVRNIELIEGISIHNTHCSKDLKTVLKDKTDLQQNSGHLSNPSQTQASNNIKRSFPPSETPHFKTSGSLTLQAGDILQINPMSSTLPQRRMMNTHDSQYSMPARALSPQDLHKLSQQRFKEAAEERQILLRNLEEQEATINSSRNINPKTRTGYDGIRRLSAEKNEMPCQNHLGVETNYFMRGPNSAMNERSHSKGNRTSQIISEVLISHQSNSHQEVASFNSHNSRGVIHPGLKENLTFYRNDPLESSEVSFEGVKGCYSGEHHSPQSIHGFQKLQIANQPIPHQVIEFTHTLDSGPRGSAMIDQEGRVSPQSNLTMRVMTRMESKNSIHNASPNEPATINTTADTGNLVLRFSGVGEDQKASPQPTIIYPGQIGFGGVSQGHKVRTTLDLRKGKGSITTIRVLNNMGDIAVGYSSGDVLFTNLSYHRGPGYGEVAKVHKSAVNSMEVMWVWFRNQSPVGKRGTRLSGLKQILLTGGSESECTILVWDLDSKKALKRLSGHQHLISSIVDLGDYAHVATSSFDSKVAIWDISQNFTCKKLLEMQNSPVLCLNFDADTKMLMAGYMDGSINLWEVHFCHNSSSGKFSSIESVNPVPLNMQSLRINSHRSRCQEVAQYNSVNLYGKLGLNSHIISIKSHNSRLFVLKSDFAITVLDINGNTLGRLVSEFPIVDFVIDFVRKEKFGEDNGSPIKQSRPVQGFFAEDVGFGGQVSQVDLTKVLAIDNRNNLLVFEFRASQRGVLSPVMVYESGLGMKRGGGEVNFFFGCNPKSQIWWDEASGRTRSMVVMKDQNNPTLIIQEFFSED